MKIDLLTMSGHKIHGPKGTGFLYVGEKVKIKPIFSEEDSRRISVRVQKMFRESQDLDLQQR